MEPLNLPPGARPLPISPDYSSLMWILPLFEKAMNRQEPIQLSVKTQLPEFATILHGIIRDYQALHQADPSTTVSQRVVNDADRALLLGNDLAVTRDEVPAVVDLLSVCIDAVFAPRIAPDAKDMPKWHSFTPYSTTVARVSACWTLLRKTEIELNLPDIYDGQRKGYNERSFRIIKAIRQSPNHAGPHQEGFQKFEDKIRSLRRELSQREAECRQYKEQIQASTSDAKESDTVSKLVKEKDHLKEELHTHRETTSQNETLLRATNENLKKELRALRKSNNQNKNLLRATNEKLEQLESASNQKDVDSSQLESDLNALHITLSQKNTLIESLEKDKEELVKKLRAFREAKRQNDTSLQVSNNKLDKSNTSLAQKADDSTPVEVDINALKITLGRKKALIESLQKDLDLAQVTLGEKNLHYQDLEKEVTILKDLMDQKDKGIRELDQTHSSLQESFKESEATRNRLEKDVVALEDTLAQKEAACQRLEKQVGAPNVLDESLSQKLAQYDTLVKELSEVKETLRLREQYCQGLDEQLRASTENAQLRHNTDIGLEESLTATKDLLERSEKHRKRLEKKLANLPTTFEAHWKDLEETTRKLINNKWLSTAHPIMVDLMRMFHIGRQLQIEVDQARPKAKQEPSAAGESQASTGGAVGENSYPKVEPRFSQESFTNIAPIPPYERAVLRITASSILINSQGRKPANSEEAERYGLATCRLAIEGAEEEAKETLQDLETLREMAANTEKDLEAMAKNRGKNFKAPA